MSTVCIGRAHWDYLASTAMPMERSAQNAVRGKIRKEPGGVACRVALSLAAHGESVALAAAIGDDHNGHELRDHLDKHLAVIQWPGTVLASGSYLAVEFPDGMVEVTDPSRAPRYDEEVVAVVDDLPEGHSVLFDTSMPPLALKRAINKLDPGTTVRVVATSHGNCPGLMTVINRPNSSIHVNMAEARMLLDGSVASLREAARRLLCMGFEEVTVTNGSQGAAAGSGDEIAFLPAAAVLVNRTTIGAGDFFAGAYIAARNSGQSVSAALSSAVSAVSGFLGGLR